MNGPGNYPRAATADNSLPGRSDTEQLDLYAVALRDAARDEGTDRARRGDPDGFDRCVAAIRRTAHLNVTFTSDDVHRDPHVVLPGNELGSALRYLHQAGEIKPLSYEQSLRPESHGRPIRRWSASPDLRDWSES